MDRKEIENEALHLPIEDRADLIHRLVLSLDAPSSGELQSDWLSEARRRARELDEGTVQPVSGDEVARKAGRLIR